ncbi:Hypothetical predicted protein [Mytilus galloprovincialis]|uniref:Uncharacterized protein n=1 Tax=Mytilus galloprovincialis TaxID=29158 RepID=A0A8B6DYI9_MYTGA|nr:Hypothetical predicted protein [Mytilus galloprovincialis]
MDLSHQQFQCPREHTYELVGHSDQLKVQQRTVALSGQEDQGLPSTSVKTIGGAVGELGLKYMDLSHQQFQCPREHTYELVGHSDQLKVQQRTVALSGQEDQGLPSTSVGELGLKYMDLSHQQFQCPREHTYELVGHSDQLKVQQRTVALSGQEDQGLPSTSVKL